MKKFFITCKISLDMVFGTWYISIIKTLRRLAMIAQWYEKKGLEVDWEGDYRRNPEWTALVGQAVLEADEIIRHEDGSDDPSLDLRFRDGSRLEVTHPRQLYGWGDCRAFDQ
jgi:hypothetical protein